MEAKDIFLSAKEIVISNSDFSLTNKKLDEILSSINNLKGKDKEILLTFVEVSRRSLEFWSPIKEGGLGNGDVVLNQNKTMGKINWKSIGYADGAGAAGALLRTWYLAAFGPLSWGTILGAVGWGAAWASGTSLLYQLM